MSGEPVRIVEIAPGHGIRMTAKQEAEWRANQPAAPAEDVKAAPQAANKARKAPAKSKDE